MSKILYTEGYKYQLAEDYMVYVAIKPEKNIYMDFVLLSENGLLIIKKGYAWDGPSGPAIDTKNFMRGSLIHDACYQMMREGYLNYEKYRKNADLELKRVCIEDGMAIIRAWWVYNAVRHWAKGAAKPRKGNILTAP